MNSASATLEQMEDKPTAREKKKLNDKRGQKRMKANRSNIKRSENITASQASAGERIQQRAYFTSLERGGTPDRELEDWCEAERKEIEERAYNYSLQRSAESSDQLTDWTEAERQVKHEEMASA